LSSTYFYFEKVTAHLAAFSVAKRIWLQKGKGGKTFILAALALQT
jgi:hypothetical protein